MTLCDLSSFYCEKGGGVSTYHRARIDWFARQTRHRYILIVPGTQSRIRQLSSSVSTVHVRGLRASRDPDRYRLLIDYAGVRAAIEHVSPDVLETHDPWFSLPIGLMLRYRGPYRGLLTTYCHSDPIRTYIRPRLGRWLQGLKLADRFERWADRQLHRQHAACDAVFVASDTMRTRLTGLGLTRVTKSPFGVDRELLHLARRAARRPTRVLYAGRLDDDKEFGLVLEILPALLQRSDVWVTVAGAGKYAGRVASLKHPRLRYLGHVMDRASMRTVYALNDVLLAPGRYETFGLSALEGAAAGLLVVGPNVGGSSELLQQWRSPLAFSAGNAEAFFNCVLAALDGQHSDLIQRERRIVNRYGSWPEAVARQVATYETMLGPGVDQPVCRTA